MYFHPSLVKRVFKSKTFSHFSLLEGNASYVHGQYRSWNRINMKRAVKAVEEGTFVRKAAEKFIVPRSSLHDRVTGRVHFEARSGPSSYLLYEEEAAAKIE